MEAYFLYLYVIEMHKCVQLMFCVPNVLPAFLRSKRF